jgi:hypothetical protein
MPGSTQSNQLEDHPFSHLLFLANEVLKDQESQEARPTKSESLPCTTPPQLEHHAALTGQGPVHPKSVPTSGEKRAVTRLQPILPKRAAHSMSISNLSCANPSTRYSHPRTPLHNQPDKLYSTYCDVLNKKGYSVKPPFAKNLTLFQSHCSAPLYSKGSEALSEDIPQRYLLPVKMSPIHPSDLYHSINSYCSPPPHYFPPPVLSPTPPLTPNSALLMSKLV